MKIFPKNDFNEIELLEDMISRGNLIEEECPSNQNFDSVKDSVILASLNKEVSKINTEFVDHLPGEHKSFKSYDSEKRLRERRNLIHSRIPQYN